jgi:hypothetical protein
MPKEISWTEIPTQEERAASAGNRSSTNMGTKRNLFLSSRENQPHWGALMSGSEPSNLMRRVAQSWVELLLQFSTPKEIGRTEIPTQE